jgi:membrane-bound metal-dependent hydrolase YbcI (DUF457 family)
VDPVSHAVIGRLIAAAAPGRGSPRRGAGFAAALGALSPDVDFLLMPVGWDIYLRAHEIGTHTIAGALITGLGSAGLVRAAVRGSRYRTLAAAAIAGAASHLAADVASGARLRPAWPFVDTMVSGPLVAMADPWPIAILVAGLAVLWRVRARRRETARAVLVTLVAFLAVKAVLLGAAMRSLGVPAAPVAATSRVIEAQWGSLTRWHVFERTGTAITHRAIDARGREPALILSVPLQQDSAIVAASRSLDTVRNFLAVHDLGFAVRRRVDGGRRAVLWSDIRFCRASATPDDVECTLWFGGIFSADGRPISQQVRVGAWVQSRPPPAEAPGGSGDRRE